MKSTHYFGLRINGKLARFSSPVQDKEFQELTRYGLPPGWVAWHLPEGENIDNSTRCRQLRVMPIVVFVGGGLSALEVPSNGPILSPYPTPHPGDVLSGKFSSSGHSPITTQEMLSHNHSDEFPPIEHRTRVTWCGTCGWWYKPLTESRREALIDILVDARIQSFEEQASSISEGWEIEQEERYAME